ncbi:MAG: transposase [Mesorhizobium sp.]|nr:MAG: transposase [Mesorhizobium sp.]RWP34332.1 MAG: transposase [Mesorhizobium sp.]RWP70057.1 MAG: transposase [Mesorhizobium sp.]RWQ22760.1 MAG: transposase [Mesorhizobium sp.]
MRRRWSAEAKARILEETVQPGADVSAVARALGLNPPQLFAWRRKAIRSGLAILADGAARPQGFARLEVAPRNGDGCGSVEIVIGDATIRAGGDVAPALLVEAIRAVRSV